MANFSPTRRSRLVNNTSPYTPVVGKHIVRATFVDFLELSDPAWSVCAAKSSTLSKTSSQHSVNTWLSQSLSNTIVSISGLSQPAKLRVMQHVCTIASSVPRNWNLTITHGCRDDHCGSYSNTEWQVVIFCSRFSLLGTVALTEVIPNTANTVKTSSPMLGKLCS